MKKILILGAGMVGKAMAIDLCRDFAVTSADINPEALEALAAGHPVQTVRADLSDPERVKELAAGYDLVIGAAPGFMGFQTLKAVIECGKNMVDISFFDENAHDPFSLDDLAGTRGVTAVIDCGVAPGMSNIILGYHHARMKVESFECYVGGLPQARTWPYQYKAPFSPIDVLEEYTRPARLMENGRVVAKPALSEPEYLEVEGLGTLEAFNTDGLRTLLKTTPVANMKEKTLRYPGHIEYMRVLRETGFFGVEPVEINGAAVRPIDLTAKLLFPKWKLGKNEREFTVMEVRVEGEEQGRAAQYVYRLFDRFDEATGLSSMSRTTGFTCTAAARLILEGHFTRKGICPPEYLGAAEGCFQRIWDYLGERNVRYRLVAEPAWKSLLNKSVL